MTDTRTPAQIAADARHAQLEDMVRSGPFPVPLGLREIAAVEWALKIWSAANAVTFAWECVKTTNGAEGGEALRQRLNALAEALDIP